MHKILNFLLFKLFILISCTEKDKNVLVNDKNKIFLLDNYCTNIDDYEKNPLSKYQWHLKNIGQTAFSSEGGVIGEDINIYSVLKEECLSGKGIYVGVIDSGLQIGHPSLLPNIDNRPKKSKTWSLNFRLGSYASNDPSPLQTAKSDHGTMVAGIIGMRSNLGFGGTGVAPRVNLAGYNVINHSLQTFQNFLDSLGLSEASKGNDIFNMSYGLKNIRQIEYSSSSIKSAQSAIKYGTQFLRNKRGAIYIKASGNGFSNLGNYLDSCTIANRLEVSCQNSNMNYENTLYEVITVGAVNAKGIKSSYSTTGSSLWISAPGGEFGVDKMWVEKLYQQNDEDIIWSNQKKSIGEPAIVTTDVSGQRNGYSRRITYKDPDEIFDVGNSFNACEVNENSKCDYTNSMNGSSAAAPIVSGSVALILEKNPILSWRDIKYILAKTAKKVDSNFKGIKIKVNDNLEYLLDQGWITNKAGFTFSNWYGFGVIDVEKAVEFAKNYNFRFPQFIEKNWISNTSEVNLSSNFGFFQTEIHIPKNESLNIESIQIRVSIESQYIGDVSLELISPQGTKNIIWHAGNAFTSNGNLDDMQMLSNAFYGEKSYGIWKLNVINTGIHKKNLKFKQWKLKVSGH
ncbi:S8 family serine peptidase [Spirobacillus cienkowskii]|jgi:subtilisin family serine protease|uniref:P/Homo B domain-containing protein n=1 Tax=Spirobacillus cienkowskii TaxID=495820 RepID=A0A369L134_9BACT|nr:MAG: hypothetical protein DCC88_01420 [Spirobacillus cienkowskii]